MGDEMDKANESDLPNVLSFCLSEKKVVWKLCSVNHLKTKRRLLYLKTQSVPRCKHFSYGL